MLTFTFNTIIFSLDTKESHWNGCISKSFLKWNDDWRHLHGIEMMVLVISLKRLGEYSNEVRPSKESNFNVPTLNWKKRPKETSASIQSLYLVSTFIGGHTFTDVAPLSFLPQYIALSSFTWESHHLDQK